MNAKRLSGVYVPVVTPFEDDIIKLGWLEENLEKLGRENLSGYLALGSNGEFMSLTVDEQLNVVKTFMKKKGNKIVMVGTARESVNETVVFSKKVIDLGADYVSILTPHYFSKNMTEDVLIRYYTQIADSLTVPVLLYNAPGFASGIKISPEVVRILAQHPNIAGMKDSSPAGMNSFLSEVRYADFEVLAGSANIYFAALLLGATGGIISVANYLPRLACEFHEVIMKKDYEKARELHFKIFEINKMVSGSHGVAGVKAAMNIMGFKGGTARSPLQVLSQDEYNKIQGLFEELGII